MDLQPLVPDLRKGGDALDPAFLLENDPLLLFQHLPGSGEVGCSGAALELLPVDSEAVVEDSAFVFG